MAQTRGFAAVLVLIAGLSGWAPSVAEEPLPDLAIDIPIDEMPRYVSAKLPLSAKSARTWVTLRETMVKPLPDGTPLAEVIRSVRNATRGKDGNHHPLNVYIEPEALKREEVTTATPVKNPFVGDDEVSLQTYLSLVLKPLSLDHRVHDGLVIIGSTRCCQCPDPVDISASEAWAWLLLQENTTLHFAKGAKLRDILATIRRSTEGKGPGGRGLILHVDPVDLIMADDSIQAKDGIQAKETLDSVVTIDVDDVPICTALSLILAEFELGLEVRQDGVVVVRYVDEEEKPLSDEFATIEAYQTLRYVYAWHRWGARLERTRPTNPQTPNFSTKPDDTAKPR